MMVQATRLSAVSSNMANVDTPGYQRLNVNPSTLTASTSHGVQATISQAEGSSQDTSNVDPLTEMTGMIEAEDSFQANATVFETGADMWDMLMSIKRD
jgi:flagellar basal-body rod protein FlgC